MASDASLKEEVEALRISVLAAASGLATADPTLRQLALAAFEQGRVAEHEVARWRASGAALNAALEARGHVAGHEPEGSAPPPRLPAGLTDGGGRVGAAEMWNVFARGQCLRVNA